jgi:hypothetical protein
MPALQGSGSSSSSRGDLEDYMMKQGVEKVCEGKSVCINGCWDRHIAAQGIDSAAVGLLAAAAAAARGRAAAHVADAARSKQRPYAAGLFNMSV